MLIRFAYQDAVCFVDGDNVALLTLEDQILPFRLVTPAGMEREMVDGDTVEFFLQPPGVRDGDGLTLSDAATVDTDRPATDDRYLLEVNAYTVPACALLGIADADATNDGVFKDCDATLIFTPSGGVPIQSQPFTLRLKSAVWLPGMGMPTAVPGASEYLAARAVLFSAAQALTAPQSLVARTNIALENVNNTSDANKPVSTATQTALDLKASAAALAAHTSDTANPHAVTKSQVGLSNVDNTSDANKPISTATQTALDGKADIAWLTANRTAVLAALGIVVTNNELQITCPDTTVRTAPLYNA